MRELGERDNSACCCCCALVLQLQCAGTAVTAASTASARPFQWGEVGGEERTGTEGWALPISIFLPFHCRGEMAAASVVAPAAAVSVTVTTTSTAREIAA